MIDHKKSRDLLQRDWLDYICNRLGTEQWVYVYSDDKVDIFDFALFYSALISNRKVKEVLQANQWDFNFGYGHPGCSVSNKNGKKTIKYHRYGNDDGIEPLVLCRSFHGAKDGYLEISEEFRLFHNLFHDQANNKYIRIDDAGDEEDVIIFEGNPRRIKIRLKQLKQFLAIKGMHLAVFFSIDRYSEKSLKELGLKKFAEEVRQSNLAYNFFVDVPNVLSDGDQRRSFSGLLGKKLIPGMSKKKSGIWPYGEERKFEKFIIGTDDNGVPITYTCNPDVLSNFFGANPGAPNYVTWVFFKREVLEKYYSNPGKYSVEDNHLSCHGLWGLRIDNNHDKYVVVALGDLGRDLPNQEQVYWKSFNVPPDGHISKTAFRRNILGKFANPIKADLVFKSTFERFRKKWQKKFGWLLFKPLAEDDQHNFKTLRVPLIDDQNEFDLQVLALAKVLIDSLNEEEIGRHLPVKIENEKGIAKLERWMELQGLTDYGPHTKFLKDFYRLRSSGVGHRKGENWKKSAAKFKLGKVNSSKVFEDILMQATDFLKYLDERLLSGKISDK